MRLRASFTKGKNLWHLHNKIAFSIFYKLHNKKFDYIGNILTNVAEFFVVYAIRFYFSSNLSASLWNVIKATRVFA